MSQLKPIPVVDLFAGPGGLGEGFASLRSGNAFNIVVSVEKDPSAYQTLLVRAFYRNAFRYGKRYLRSYYNYCNGRTQVPWDETNEDLWNSAKKEVLNAELGTKSASVKLEASLKAHKIRPSKPWVLIGGPPCQAYSIAGRSRNLGKIGYVAEEDQRHFLYKEYLSIIKKYSPSIFVMENVKGLLSSKINGNHVFHSIVKDLSSPNGTKLGPKYRIHSLSTQTFYESCMHLQDIDLRDYVIQAEDFGIPQSRHRVILLGIRDDLSIYPETLQKTAQTTVADAIFALPPVRSSISRKVKKEDDEYYEWIETFRSNQELLMAESKMRPNLTDIYAILKCLDVKKTTGNIGGIRQPYDFNFTSPNTTLDKWYKDTELKVLLNHEARAHMGSDLYRYLYASTYSLARGRSPKGHLEFDLKKLAPNHKNWESGAFSDRFRVQCFDKPATTITSHIAKDGNYFIHPDPMQCRSLTVREAARIQTFPDNYFFHGNRTEQYHQVGNAVPPLLAHKIAGIVYKALKKTAPRF